MSELFQHLNPTDNAYSYISEDEDYRQWLSALWAKFKPYADPHFLSEFGRQIKPRVFEMELGCYFLEQGFFLKEPSALKGPDLTLMTNGSMVFIEAVAPTGGDISNPNHLPHLQYANIEEDESTQVYDFPQKELMLRYISAITTKIKQYNSWDLDINDPFVIAVSPIQLDHNTHCYAEDPFNDCPTLVKALFGLLHQQISINKETGKGRFTGWSHYNKDIKVLDKTVSSDLFNSRISENVSAILYFESEYRQIVTCTPRITEYFVLNPYAKNKLSDEFLSKFHYYQKNPESYEFKRPIEPYSSR